MMVANSRTSDDFIYELTLEGRVIFLGSGVAAAFVFTFIGFKITATYLRGWIEVTANLIVAVIVAVFTGETVFLWFTLIFFSGPEDLDRFLWSQFPKP